MTPTAPAVALLFDDVELGGHLRDALNERGARIVHEGAVSGFSRALLEKVSADVLVVNLDDVADDALDNLYEAIDGTNQKVVFNDGQASGTLTGWDRARWARHLALKVFEVGEIDPPRPEQARSLEADDRPSTAEVDLAASEPSEDFPSLSASIPNATSFHTSDTYAGVAADAPSQDSSAPGLAGAGATVTGPFHVDRNAAEAFGAEPFDADASIASTAASTGEGVNAPDLSWSFESAPSEPTKANAPPLAESFLLDDAPASFEDADDHHAHTDHAHTDREESENLAAELEALLASDELAIEDDEAPSGSGLKFSSDDELPVLHDGHFGLPPSTSADADDEVFDFDALETSFNAQAETFAKEDPRPSAVTPPVFQLDHLELTPLLDAVVTTVGSTAAAPASAPALTKAVSAPTSWSLMDDDVAPAATPEKLSPAEFGIEKMSAADFLAPDVEDADVFSEPVMSLDLISMEEAIAPKPFEEISEIRLDEFDSALSQVVLLGATVSGANAVCEFLAALPATTRLFFLHTQHLGDASAETMVASLASRSALPVRLATHGARAKGGEVLVVPPGQQLRLRRDGMVDLQESGTQAANEPSIDASFSMAAGVFTRDALAIVFAGRGNDGVAGSQAVKDRGGKVWVESLSGEHSADIVSGIVAERLVSFSGSPHELAAHLIEVYP